MQVENTLLLDNCYAFYWFSNAHGKYLDTYKLPLTKPVFIAGNGAAILGVGKLIDEEN